MARITLPKNKDAAIKLAKKILAKHSADGTNSPLKGLDIEDMAKQTTTADTQNELSAKLHRDAETATQGCTRALGSDYRTPGTVNFYLASVRDVLAGLYKGNEQKLGDWGYEVDQTPAKPKAKKPPTA